MPTLICLSGLPGVGKTTIAKRLAEETGALLLWIDEIETAMKASRMQANDLADAGYAAAQAVAKGALKQGFDVIADCVNPIRLTREAWRDVSKETRARHLDVEVVCSDPRKHRYRLENRVVNLDGWVGPDWDAIQAREYETMTEAAMRIDTALTAVDQSVSMICRVIRNDAQEELGV
ncbi:AAA family ATPase [Ruegeria hyattellae]|uniref:AAA family ATPase n=1 Tax=Ruegeria hyattellae TaxID=3233337 RepID=UPI00355B7F29